MAEGDGLVPGVRIVVAGDGKTGKSSLIVAGTTQNFPSNVLPVLPPTRLPEHLYPGDVPVTIIDTSSRFGAAAAMAAYRVYAAK
ncbi:Mitochondrial Rho GTPase 1 [Castilleja foliolosa]|uniref:Mitochondrial Rho GTPase 1 n=1 Tax=Castilleja foliolosa TaxID=1961234 RepID=A0ABD3D416_9LAMI